MSLSTQKGREVKGLTEGESGVGGIDARVAVHEVDTKEASEKSTKGIDTNPDPPVEVVKDSVRTSVLVNFDGRFEQDRLLCAVGTDGSYFCAPFNYPVQR